MAKHCWHGSDFVLASYPPLYPETCCNCGKYRTVSLERLVETDKHGPYAPERGTTVPDYNPSVSDDEECPGSD